MIDAATNVLSVIQILEQFNFPTFPRVIPQFTVVSMLTREPNEPQKNTIQIRFTLDRKKLVDLPLSVDFQTGLRHRSLGDISGLTVPKAGVLRAALRYNNKTLGTWVIEITDTGQKPQITPVVQQPAPPPKSKAKKAKKKSSRKLRSS